jgi:hypothetical protein
MAARSIQQISQRVGSQLGLARIEQLDLIFHTEEAKVVYYCLVPI